MIKKLNKVKKGMAALLVAGMCMIPGISSVAAAPTYTPNQVYTCDWCGVGLVLESITSTDKVVSKKEDCIHYPYGSDIIWTWETIKTHKCNYCGMGYRDQPVTHETTECHGFHLK